MINTRRERQLTTIATPRPRITFAILVGILLGCILAFNFPHAFHPPVSLSRIAANSNSQVASRKCESSIKLLKAEFALAVELNAYLKKEFRILTEKLELAQQRTVKVPKQVFVLGEQPKAGPFGTVKGLRTNPTVSPGESSNPRLAKILNRVAIERELIVTLANSNEKDILEFWLKNIKKVGIPNFLVIALDEEIADFCQTNGVPVYKRPDPNGNMASGPKFHILREILQLGYSVLLSDTDIIYLQNPFPYLYKDSDVEAMSDGHNNITAYGYDDVFDEPSMGWARFAHSIRIWVYNSGFFYIRPTLPSIELVDRVSLRLSQEPKSWDQAVFNEELFHPSYPGYNGVYASKRTMDFFLFMNSKVLFKTVRTNINLRMMLEPVVVHVNYHPDKLSRLKGIEQYYINGKDDALDRFPEGSEW